MPRKKKLKKITKKRSVRGVSKRIVAKKVVPKKVSKPVRAMPVKNIRKRKINIVIKNLVLFAILFILSVIIASASRNELVDNLFWILAILTAFVAVAFLIILLIFVFMKRMKK